MATQSDNLQDNPKSNPENNLETIAENHKIRIHEPFAQFLKAQKKLTDFDISLNDCYRLAGHACYAITGAYLVTAAAVKELFPETNVCERGDITFSFGTKLTERATGPRSNVISYITGAWGESGFPGLGNKFVRKDLVYYEDPSVSASTVLFTRLSNNKSVLVEYNPSRVVETLDPSIPFPDSWRVGLCAVLNNINQVIHVHRPS